MKNRRKRAKQVRQRKVATLASYSRNCTVKNCTIPKVDKDQLIEMKVPWGAIDSAKGKAEWTIPKEGYPQPKTLRKKYKKKYWNKGTHILRKIITHPSDYILFPNHVFHPKGRAWFMEQMVQHKIAKWEKKNPCPVKPNQNPPDMFEEEYITPWKASREIAIERIRDFVVSMYDKLPLTGRFQESSDKYTEEKVAEIKDINMEGHKINDLNPKESKLLKKAQKETNKVKAKRSNLVCTNLKDHKRTKGRLILPKAA